MFVVKAYANAIGHAAAPARTLVGRRLADGLHHQLLHFISKAVALDTGGACINHIPNAGHRERGFGHVGGQDNAPLRVRIKNAVLLSLRQAGKHGQHFGVALDGVVAQVPPQVVGSLAYLALAGQKHQNIARHLAHPKFVHRLCNGVVEVKVAGFFKRPPAQLHRKSPARHHQHGRGLHLARS